MSTKPDFLPHYTQADKKLVSDIRGWMTKNKQTQASLARLVRISDTQVSQLLNGIYPTSPSESLAKIESAIENLMASGSGKVPIVETSVNRLVNAACQYARVNGGISVIAANVGTGKTVSLKDYAAKNSNTFLIELTPITTSSVILHELAVQIFGSPQKGSLSAIMEKITKELKDTDSLIILDEAETITGKPLNLVRRIRDKAGIGLVLSGTPYLSGLLIESSDVFGQIASRASFAPEPILKITPDDAAAICRAGFPNEDIADDIITAMYQYTNGSARMLVETLITGIRNYRKPGDAITQELVNFVAVKARRLKKSK